MRSKKFDGKPNVAAEIITNARLAKNYKKVDVCNKLQLFDVYLHRNEYSRIENNLRSLKDFELIAICIVLDIDMEKLKKLISQ